MTDPSTFGVSNWTIHSTVDLTPHDSEDERLCEGFLGKDGIAQSNDIRHLNEANDAKDDLSPFNEAEQHIRFDDVNSHTPPSESLGDATVEETTFQICDMIDYRHNSDIACQRVITSTGAGTSTEKQQRDLVVNQLIKPTPSDGPSQMRNVDLMQQHDKPSLVLTEQILSKDFEGVKLKLVLWGQYGIGEVHHQNVVARIRNRCRFRVINERNRPASFKFFLREERQRQYVRYVPDSKRFTACTLFMVNDFVEFEVDVLPHPNDQPRGTILLDYYTIRYFPVDHGMSFDEISHVMEQLKESHRLQMLPKSEVEHHILF